MASRTTPDSSGLSYRPECSKNKHVSKTKSNDVPVITRQKQELKGCSVLYKVVVLICMSLNNAGITLLIYYTRNKTSGPMYLTSTSVLLVEAIKLAISMVMLLYQSKSFSSFLQIIFKELICRPGDFLKVLLPALLYAIQNKLIYVALQYLDPATYQVSIQLKILTTALLMRILLKKKLSTLQWFSLILLFFGVVTVHLKPEVISQFEKKPSWDYAIGLSVVVICCLCSSLAGVYFEKILKEDDTSFWIRNLEMYIWGMVTIGLGMYVQDYDHIKTNGWFHGYNSFVWILIGINSLGGICASLVIKYLDNIFKTLSAAGGVLVAGYVSYTIFSNELYMQFFCGSICVFMAIFLYITR